MKFYRFFGWRMPCRCLLGLAHNTSTSRAQKSGGLVHAMRSNGPHPQVQVGTEYSRITHKCLYSHQSDASTTHSIRNYEYPPRLFTTLDFTFDFPNAGTAFACLEKFLCELPIVQLEMTNEHEVTKRLGLGTRHLLKSFIVGNCQP